MRYLIFIVLAGLAAWLGTPFMIKKWPHIGEDQILNVAAYIGTFAISFFVFTIFGGKK